jgi:protein-disulfide isomerase
VLNQAPPAVAGEQLRLNQQALYYLLIAIIFFAAGFSVAWLTLNSTLNTVLAQVRSDTAVVAAAAAQTAIAPILNGAVPQANAQTAKSVDAGDSPAWGPADAAVTVVEFSDFQCPFCQRFKFSSYRQIKDTYGDRVRFVFKHFPLTQIHPQAVPASLAAECAREQGKFWEFHDLAFQDIQGLTRQAFMDYARQIGVADVDAFGKCFDTGKYQDRVAKDYQQGIALGVEGTPTFFINGVAISGALPFENFAALIDKQLASAAQS